MGVMIQDAYFNKNSFNMKVPLKVLKYDNMKNDEHQRNSFAKLLMIRIKECFAQENPEGKAYIINSIFQILNTKTGRDFLECSMEFCDSILKKIDEFKNNETLTQSWFYDEIAFKNTENFIRRQLIN